MSKLKRLEDECLNRDWGISISWQRINNWSIEVGTRHKLRFYTDGHITKKDALKKALKYFKEMKDE